MTANVCIEKLNLLHGIYLQTIKHEKASTTSVLQILWTLNFEILCSRGRHFLLLLESQSWTAVLENRSDLSKWLIISGKQKFLFIYLFFHYFSFLFKFHCNVSRLYHCTQIRRDRIVNSASNYL